MISAFGIDHGEVSKKLGKEVLLPLGIGTAGAAIGNQFPQNQKTYTWPPHKDQKKRKKRA